MRVEWLTVAMAAVLVAVWWWRPLGVTRLVVADVARRSRRPSWLAALASTAGAPSLGRRIAGGLVVSLVVGWLASGPSPWVGVGSGLVAGTVAVVASGRLSAAGVAHDDALAAQDLPQALEFLAGALRAGLPVATAASYVAEVIGGPVGHAWGRVLALVSVGVPESTAWRSLADHPVWGPPARDIAFCLDSGAPLGPLLVLRAKEVARANALAAQQRARSVGVRSVVPLSLCFLPAFVVLGVVPFLADRFLPVFAGQS